MDKYVRILITIFLLVGASSPLSGDVRAFAHNDFDGTWQLDRHLSSPVSGFNDLVFVISQTSVEFHVTRVIKRNKRKDRVSEVTYYTDGRGEETPLLLTTDKLKSTTHWVDDKLVRKFRVTGFITGDVYYLDHTETWFLSPDGKFLTIDTEVKPGHVPMLFRNVIKDESYHRVFHSA